jgi:nucleoside-diphosphate-sugar epimerase
MDKLDLCSKKIFKEKLVTWVTRRKNHLEGALLIEKIKSKSEITFKTLPKDDRTRRRHDITEARKLDWEPETDFANGLEKTFERFGGELEE